MYRCSQYRDLMETISLESIEILTILFIINNPIMCTSRFFKSFVSTCAVIARCYVCQYKCA